MGKDLTGLTRALSSVADEYPLDVVRSACSRLTRTSKYPPTPADLTAACELFAAILHPKVVQLYSGLLDMDFGHGRIDMKGLTVPEQDRIIKDHGMIGGKNAALLTLTDKKAALEAQKQLGYSVGDADA